MLVVHPALIRASWSPDGSQGRGIKNVAPNDLVAPRYCRFSETNLGEKVHFFNCDVTEFGVARIQP